MRSVFISICLAACLIVSGVYIASAALVQELNETNSRTVKPVVKDEVQVAQRRWGGGFRRHNNFRRQQQLQQQRRIQQQRQRQQMEQRRRQQAQQRQRMQEQRRRQQQVMRQRRQQMAVQRQRMLEQRRLAQNRQRQELQRRQGQQRQVAQKQALQTQKLARQRIQDQQRLRRLRELRTRNQRIKVQKAQQKQRDLAVVASLRTVRSVSALKAPSVRNRLKATSANFQKIKASQRKLGKPKERANSRTVKKPQKVAALKKTITCAGGACKCSFHGDTLVKTQKGFIPIHAINAGVDFVWAKDEYTGKADWKKVKYHYSNWYEQTVEISIQDAEGIRQKIVSNTIHPFFAQLKPRFEPFNSTRQNDLTVRVNAIDSNRLRTTSNGTWVTASDLTIDHQLLNDAGIWSRIVSVETRKERFEAFNLTVSDFHTYFVAANDNAAPVWVHNDCNIKQAKADLKKSRTIALNNTSAKNVANAKRLAKQLQLQSARSPFSSDGKLTARVVKQGKEIIPADRINNPNIPKGYAKYQTPTYQSPSGDFKVHYYYNKKTNSVLYDRDYKTIFNHQGRR